MSYSFSHKKIIMNLQDAEQFLQEQQNILENQRQQKTRRVQQAFFMIHVLFVALNAILLILNYQKTGEWNLLYLGLEFHVSNIDFKVFKDRFCLSTEMK